MTIESAVDFWALNGRADARGAVEVSRAIPDGGAALALNSIVLGLQMAAEEGDDAIVANVRAFLDEQPDLPTYARWYAADEAPVPLVPTEAARRLRQLDPQIANPDLLMQRVFRGSVS